MIGGMNKQLPLNGLQTNNNLLNKQSLPVKTQPVLAPSIIKDTKGTKDDDDDYDEDGAYDEDFVDEDEEETFKKTAADFAKQLNQLKTVNDKRKEIVDKMERDVVTNKNSNPMISLKPSQVNVKGGYKLPTNMSDNEEEDEFDKEFEMIQKNKLSKPS
jgi:hypothetical protein